MAKVVLELNSCNVCPFWKEGQRESTDGFDSGNDWICTKNNNKIIAGFVEWHEVKKIEVPKWCPITVESSTIMKKAFKKKYVVITPEGKEISVEEYMETEDYSDKLEQQVTDFLTNKKQKELIKLFNTKR